MACIAFRTHHPLSVGHRLGNQWHRRRTVASLFDDMLAQSFSDSDWGLTPFTWRTRTRTRRDGGGNVWSRYFSSTAAPHAEAIETEDSWRVQVEVPGVAADSIKVDFDDREGTLIIAGTSRQSLRAQPQASAGSDSDAGAAADNDDSNKAADASGSEESARTFTYRYKLGARERVNEAGIAATLHNGLLTVTVPKKAPVEVPSTTRAIPISTATPPSTTASSTDATITTATGNAAATADSRPESPSESQSGQPQEAEPFKV